MATTPFASGSGSTSTPPAGLTGSQWTDWYLNNTPEAGWVKYLQDMGLYGVDPAGRYARNQYQRVYGKYTSAASENPNLGFYDWVKGAGLDLAGEFGNLAPSDRGDFSSRTLAPKVRFTRAY